MPTSSHEFLEVAAPWIAGFHAVAAALNLGAALAAARRWRLVRAGLWLALAAGFAWLALRACQGAPVEMPTAAKAALDRILGPVTFTVGWLAVVVVFLLGRRWLVRPAAAWVALNASLLFMGLSLADRNFAAIVTKPDNLPIVAMVYLVAFFTWLATAQAVENDRRLAAGGRPVESQYADTVLVWPDVVYLELIGTVVATVLLIVWSLLVRAPLEQPANPVVTPNPSKAPWYFLGLQEMLVYFAPWMAGVTLPLLIILGLMAIPYLDVNPKGNGYYTIRQRPLAYAVFQFGFLQLWIVLILIGTFMRGPNWSFYGLYQSQEEHTAVAMTNVSLAEYAWQHVLGRGLPQAPPDSGGLVQLGCILAREAFGIVGLTLYYVGLPWLAARTFFRDVRQRMGRGRYAIMILLLLTMLILPLKMILNWTLHMNYIVNVPEYFFYF